MRKQLARPQAPQKPAAGKNGAVFTPATQQRLSGHVAGNSNPMSYGPVAQRSAKLHPNMETAASARAAGLSTVSSANKLLSEAPAHHRRRGR